jgi:hypothetical protein
MRDETQTQSDVAVSRSTGLDTRPSTRRGRLARVAALGVTLAAALIGLFGLPGFREGAAPPSGPLGGLRGVVDQFWVCDDAFISFRYAENLARGRGLVFNVGEHVEGYTNFLWNVLLAAGIAVEIDPIDFGHWVGALCHAATVILLLAFTRALLGATSLPLGIAAVAYALHQHAQIYASCGLETAAATLLVTALIAATHRAERPAGFVVAGSIGTLAALVRMDLALCYAAAGLLVLVRPWGRRTPHTCSRLRAFAWTVLPALAIYLPYFLWRWSYYGYLLPNVFYARSVEEGYTGQGLHYASLYFETYWILLPALVIPAALLLLPATRSARRDPAPWLILGVSWSYLGYVLWTGGGFMFARYLVPITPALLLAYELLRRHVTAAWFAIALCSLVTGGTLLRDYPEEIATPHGSRYVFEERNNYPPTYVELFRRMGRHLRELLRDVDTRVAILGKQAMLAYHADFTLAIECANGLTDEHLAHLEVDERGPIGHEKGIGRDYDYLHRRGVQFLIPVLVSHEGVPEHRRLTLGTIDVGGIEFPVPAMLIAWRPDFVSAVRDLPGVEVVDMPAYLDAYIARMDGLPTERIAADLAEFEAFYFRFNDDEQRRTAIRERVLPD